MITTRNGIFNWGAEHRSLVTFMSAVSLSRIATTIVYGVLPILVATSYGDWQSGLFFGAMNFLQAFIGDPLAGILADRWGSKPIVIAGYGFVAAAAVLWFFMPLDTFIALTVFSLLIFASFSFRDESDAYLLRMSRRNEGGFIFGIAENLYAFANFIAALAIPFFIVTSMHRSAALVMLVTSFFSCLVTLKLPNDKKRSFNFLKKKTNAARNRGGDQGRLAFREKKSILPAAQSRRSDVRGNFLWHHMVRDTIADRDTNVLAYRRT